MSIITDITVDFNRHDIVLISRENKMTLVRDLAGPLTQNLPKTEAEKIKKYEKLALEIKNIWKLNNVCTYPFSHLSRRSGHEKLPMIYQRI